MAKKNKSSFQNKSLKQNTGSKKAVDLSVPSPENAVTIFIEKHGFLVLLSLMTLISFVVFKDFIIFKKVYLFKDIGSDSINAFLPYWVHISDYLRTDGIPQWSHEIGMGQSVSVSTMGTYPFSLIFFIIGRDSIPYAIIYVELLKIFLTGIVIYYYLRLFKTSNFVAIVGALMFAFSGYMILGGGGWYQQSTETFFVAFLLFSLEQFLKNKWYWLPISAFAIGIWHAYFFFPFGVFLLIYLSVRYIDEHGFNLKKLTAVLFYGGLCFLLGVFMSSVFVINFLLTIYDSSRISGSASGFSKYSSLPVLGTAEPIEYISFLMRLFSNDLIGNGNNYKGWGNYLEGPVLYMGLPSLLLFSQFYLGLTKERKMLYIACALFVLMIIIFPFFRYMFWGFGLDYFRTFSFFISIFVFYIGIRALGNIVDKNSRVNLASLSGTIIICTLILYFKHPIKDRIILKDIREIITFLLLSYTVLLILFRYNIRKPVVKVLFLLLLCIELIYYSNNTVKKRDAQFASELKEKTGYNDFTVDAVNYLNETEKEPYYRITKSYFSGSAMHASMNDAMIQHYKSTISYSSFNQGYYIRFLEGVNIVKKGDPNDSKWASGVMNRPLLQSLVSCKYVLKKAQEQPMDSMGYEKIKTFGDVDLYRNKNYVPLGITYDEYITSSDFEKMSDLQKDVSLFHGVVIPDSLVHSYSQFERLALNDTTKSFTWNDYYGVVDSLKREHFSISKLSNNHIEGNIHVARKKIAMFSIPYDEGWKLKVNGKPLAIEIVNYGLIGVPLDEGNSIITLDYQTPYKYLGLILSSAFFLIFVLLFALFRKKTLLKISEHTAF